LSSLRRLAGSTVRALERRVFPSAGTDADRHWQRQVMNAAVEARLAAAPVSSLDAVEISGDLHAHRPWGSYTALAYPDFDLCAPLTEERRFDYVICEQVLEHVEDPWAAVDNLRELCRPGGHVLVSTPFLVKVHEFPAYGMLDYWRFTPRGLRTLLERFGLEVESVESWGNRECVVGNFTDWAAYRRWLSLRNEPDFPVQVWAFARRPHAD
jgi:SAM-dependent methyltransferase